MFRPAVLSLSKQTSSTLTRVASRQAFLSTSSILREVAQDDVRSKLKSALKTAMKAKEKDTAGTIRVRGTCGAEVENLQHGDAATKC